MTSSCSDWCEQRYILFLSSNDNINLISRKGTLLWIVFGEWEETGKYSHDPDVRGYELAGGQLLQLLSPAAEGEGLWTTSTRTLAAAVPAVFLRVPAPHWHTQEPKSRHTPWPHGFDPVGIAEYMYLGYVRVHCGSVGGAHSEMEGV